MDPAFFAGFAGFGLAQLLCAAVPAGAFGRWRVCWFGFVLSWTGFGWRIRGCCAVGGGGRLLGDGGGRALLCIGAIVLLSVLAVRRGSG